MMLLRLLDNILSLLVPPEPTAQRVVLPPELLYELLQFTWRPNCVRFCAEVSSQMASLALYRALRVHRTAAKLDAAQISAREEFIRGAAGDFVRNVALDDWHSSRSRHIGMGRYADHQRGATEGCCLALFHDLLSVRRINWPTNKQKEFVPLRRVAFTPSALRRFLLFHRVAAPQGIIRLFSVQVPPASKTFEFVPHWSSSQEPFSFTPYLEADFNSFLAAFYKCGLLGGATTNNHIALLRRLIAVSEFPDLVRWLHRHIGRFLVPAQFQGLLRRLLQYLRLHIGGRVGERPHNV